MNEREPDYYAILNLPPDSAVDVVREQYRRLVMVFHPDRNGGDRWCEQQLMLVNRAYEMLSDPDTKAKYDSRRDRRADDAINFDEAFQVDESADRVEDGNASWTFDAGSGESESRLEPASASAAWNTLFVEPTVATAVFKPAPPVSARAREQRPGGYVAAAVAGILLAAAFFAGERHAGGGPHVSSVFGRPVAANAGTLRLVRRATAAQDSAVMSAAAITPDDIRRADAERHAEALAVRGRIAPYWARFKRSQPGAEAAIIAGKNLLVSMQNLDQRQLGGTAPVGSGRFRDEAKLSSDIQELQDKISDIQARFDDLDYMSGDDDIADSLGELNRLLRSIENQQDPLFSDLRIAAAETGRSR